MKAVEAYFFKSIVTSNLELSKSTVFECSNNPSCVDTYKSLKFRVDFYINMSVLFRFLSVSSSMLLQESNLTTFNFLVLPSPEEP